ncbi:MAG: hypothetical protein WDN29_16375 [Methylovirgula sp.]
MREIAQELDLCQRYFYSRAYAIYSAGSGGYQSAFIVVIFPATMRATPAVTTIDGGGSSGFVSVYASASQFNGGGLSFSTLDNEGCTISVETTGNTTVTLAGFAFAAGAEL